MKNSLLTTRAIILLFASFIFISNVKGQERMVSGKVTSSEDGSALPGVNVLVKGTTQGTVTDVEGNYTLEVSDENGTLVFSSIGYTSQEMPMNGRSEINVALAEDVQSLNEVVVVGYGEVQRKDLTGSVGSVDIDETVKTPVATIDQAIQGRVPGVFVTSVNGSPGAATTIRIRGGNSINAGNEPLYVVDGFISDASIVSSLNPEDIESIDILKDASAVSIYGARGSNGVILVTTKRGRAGQSEISFSSYYAIQEIAKKVDLLNAQEYIDFVNQGEEFLGNPPAFTNEDRERIGAGTDWQERLTRNAPMYNAQLSVLGGTEKTKFYLSGNYFNQDGLLLGNEYERSLLRLNLEHQASKLFEIGTNINLSRVKDIPARFAWSNVPSYHPTLPIRQEDGTYTITQDVTGNDFNNPFARDEFVENEIITNQIFSNSYLQFNILEKLKWKTTLGVSLRGIRQNQYTSSQLPIRLTNGLLGEGSVNTASTLSLLTENTLNYNFDLGESQRFNVLAGFTYQREEREDTDAISNQALTDLLSVYGLDLASPENTSIVTDFTAYRLASLIGRINYTLFDKYLFTLTARQDGSSRFGENNRYAFFPSAAFAWRLSDEEFIKKLGVFDFLKLRFSYGKSGNSNGIGAFQRFQALNTVFTSLGRGVRDVGVINAQLANDDLKWETTDQYDIGLEMGFLEGKLNFEVDFYYKKTKDLLFTREISSQTGFLSRLENIGSLENRGIDFSTNAIIIDNSDFKWDLSFNISTYKNKILELGGDNKITTNTLGVNVSGPTGQLIEGQPLGIFTGFSTNGIYQTQEQVDEDNFTNGYVPGEYRFVDFNGDGTISVEDDLTIIGDSNPDFYGGFQNSFSYKGFELSAFLQFVYGNDIYNIPKTTMVRAHAGTAYGIYRNAWTPENTNTNIPVAQAQNAQSSNDFNVENGSFLRLKTLQFAYNIPTQEIGIPLKSVKVYFTGNNLFQLISNNFNGDDPESNSFGTNERLRGYYDFTYPSFRSFVFGLDVNF